MPRKTKTTRRAIAKTKPFHVPICRQDRSSLDPAIAAAFDAATNALDVAMQVCQRGIEIERFSRKTPGYSEIIEAWWNQIDSLVDLMVQARLSFKTVHGRLTLAQQQIKGSLPDFGGTTGDCGHDVAVKIVGDVVSICKAMPEFLAIEFMNGTDKQIRKWELIHPHLKIFAVVNGEKLVALMWIEAVLASQNPSHSALPIKDDYYPSRWYDDNTTYPGNQIRQDILKGASIKTNKLKGGRNKGYLFSDVWKLSPGCYPKPRR